jgi:hypothetical protein
MGAPYAGQTGTFYGQTPGASSALQAGEAMTQVGSTLQYFITDRTKAWWDPNKEVIVYDGVTPVAGCKIDHAGGYVTLPATPAGVVTVSAYTFPMERIGGGYGFICAKKGSALDTTIFPALAATLLDKTFIGSGIMEWTASLKRHFFYALANFTTALGTANANLTWTWKASGTPGNLESVEYVAGVSLAVARVGHKTTVTYEAGSTLASAVKAAVEADPILKELWDISYPAGNDGSGEVGDVTETPLTGGRDSTDQLADVAKKVLVVFYLENDTPTSARLEGVGIITNLNFDDPLEVLVESDLDFEGTGAFCFHSN